MHILVRAGGLARRRRRMRTFSRSKTWCGIETFVVAVLTCGVPAFGQAPTGAQKAAAAWSTAVVFGPIAASSLNSSSIKATPFQDLLVTRIKPPGGKDLL